MSANNLPTAVAAVSVAQRPTPPHSRYNPCCLAPHVDLEHLRAVERRARQDIAQIEQDARIVALKLHPLEALPRVQSNIRSVKRTRIWRKEADRVLGKAIDSKVARNRELDRCIEELTEKVRQVQQEVEELEKLPDVEPDEKLPYVEPNLVQVDEVTPEQLMHNIIVGVDFHAHYGALANSIIDSHPFADPPDCEPTLNPKFLMAPATQVPGELEGHFVLDEDDLC